MYPKLLAELEIVDKKAFFMRIACLNLGKPCYARLIGFILC